MQRDPRIAAVEWLHRRGERDAEVRRLDRELDWRTWIRRRFAAYWYGLLVIFFDMAIVATIFSAFPRPSGAAPYGIALAFLVPAVYLEWEAYRLLWPPEDEELAEEARRADPAVPRTARKVRRPVEDATENERPPET